MKIACIFLCFVILASVFAYPSMYHFSLKGILKTLSRVEEIPPIFFEWGGLFGDVLGVLTFGLRLLPWLFETIFNLILHLIPELFSTPAFSVV